MKITVEHADLPENEVILRCPTLDEEMLGVLSLLRSGLQRLCVWDDSRQATLLSPNEVIYCETVEDKVFVYTGRAMYQTALSLGELESRYGALGFSGRASRRWSTSTASGACPARGQDESRPRWRRGRS